MIFWKYTGKLNWLLEHTGHDLATVALQMARKSKSANLGDLKDINRMVKKGQNKENVVNFPYSGEREDVKVIRIGNASFKAGAKVIGGEVGLLKRQCHQYPGN